MSDEFVTTREFEGFCKRIDGQFQQVTDATGALHAKLDTLILGSVSEARVIGEISGAIKAINERLERQERETAELRRLQESEVAGLKGEIKSVREEQASNTKGHVNWFMQLAMLVIAAIFWSVIGKVWK